MADEQGPEVDRVQMVSIAKDGTPDQTPGFEIIGDPEVATDALAEQLAERRVAAEDAEAQAEAREDGDEDGDATGDPDYEGVTDGARDEAEAIVAEHGEPNPPEGLDREV